MCVCVQRRPLCARHLDSVHLQRQRGQKRHPFLVSGRGAIDTNKSPFYFLPSVLGLCQECPRSIVPQCSVFGNPSPSILCCSQRLLPPPCSLTHMHGHTHMHKPADTNTPPGQCVPWSLTLNRPPRLNTTDRQASGHQVRQVTHGD